MVTPFLVRFKRFLSLRPLNRYCLRPPDRLYYEGSARAYLGLWDLGRRGPLRPQTYSACASDGADSAACERCNYTSPLL